jgi:hypothetical protein
MGDQSVNNQDFQDVLRLVNCGQLIVGVDRPSARRFYTDIPLSEVFARTGESPYLAKAVVMGAFYAGYLLLCLYALLSIVQWGWWALGSVPLGIVAYSYYASASCIGGARITGISLLLAAAGAYVVVEIPANVLHRTSLLLFIYVSALWAARFTYSAATMFLRRFVLRNPAAWLWAREVEATTIIAEDNATAAGPLPQP